MNVINLIYNSIEEIGAGLSENASRLNIDQLVDLGLIRMIEDKSDKSVLKNFYQDIDEKISGYFKIASEKTCEMQSQIFLLPLVKNSFYLDKMNGILAHTDGDSNIYIYLDIENKVNSNYIKSICIHEYQHILRNFIGKQKKSKTLLDVFIDEGCSEAFVESILGGGFVGNWATNLTPYELKTYLALYEDKLYITDVYEIQKIMYGNQLDIPLWLGYSLGYAIVKSYMENQTYKDFTDLIKLDPYEVYYKSSFYDGCL
ncbi:DUF2268 domain-containing putative Zn-dependent protease [Rummeliibacillus sp. SL167]|uniref:DUF2268 domain-containing putative Zn-dependent protease n=1 Tax=Rummeliibacillus sp. SL167 TaxID=2579792 RepID=UPI0011B5FC55|nr:DUF2268 domain-containing putative Zn-dependent protease [Rummeliibacillus sp. SL167]